MDKEKRLLLAQLTHAYVNEYLAAPGVEFQATRKHAHSLEQKALANGITRRDFTKCREAARKIAYKENPAMATKRKTTKNPRNKRIDPIRWWVFSNNAPIYTAPNKKEAERLALDWSKQLLEKGLPSPKMAIFRGRSPEKAKQGISNPRAHIPAIRGRGRPAKKRRKTVLAWTDRKGHKHSLEFKGHSVESMKQLATSMVANGETSEVIVDY